MANWLGKWFGSWFGASAPSQPGAISGSASIHVSASATASWYVVQPPQVVTRVETLYVTATVPTVWFRYSQLAIHVGNKAAPAIYALPKVPSLHLLQVESRLVFTRKAKKQSADKTPVAKASVKREKPTAPTYSQIRGNRMFVSYKPGEMTIWHGAANSMVVRKADNVHYAKKGLK